MFDGSIFLIRKDSPTSDDMSAKGPFTRNVDVAVRIHQGWLVGGEALADTVGPLPVESPTLWNCTKLF